MSNLGIPARSEDYSEWYNQLVVKADLAEDSAVRGCMVIKPHGYAVWENMQRALDDMFKETGHVNAYFPLLIPKSFLEREADHVEGFAKECAVVTHYRLKASPDGKGLVVDPDAKLEEELIIRPTSETIIWHTYTKWIQSYRDLPILINQWANVMRWEMRTRKFLRTSEFLWQEGHTAHATWEEAEAESRTILEVYTRFSEDWMAVPVIGGVKSEGEKFPGADHTYTIEAMTQDLKAIQAGTSHHLGDNFAKAFGTQFVNKENQLQYVFATSWGVSTRLVGTLIMAHSDDRGFVCPPKLAPVQLVIIPMGRDEETRARTVGRANEIAAALKLKGVRVKVDSREKESPGFKYNYWELRGACLRMELGPRDLDANTTIITRRDLSEKVTLSLDDVETYVIAQLADMQQAMFDRALAFREANTKRLDTWEEFEANFAPDGATGFVVAHWDGTDETADAINAKTKTTIRCIPLQPLAPGDDEPGVCIYSGKPSAKRVVFAKAY